MVKETLDEHLWLLGNGAGGFHTARDFVEDWAPG